MNQLRSRPGLRLLALALALCAAALVVAACAPAAPTAAPAATQPPAAAAPTQVSAPTPIAATGGKSAAATEIPVGVDADGNFYRGDPKAAVKLTEYSDFQ